jgi:hypothetical protein
MTILCSQYRRETMNEDSDNYFIESVSEQLALILWTSLSTLIAVGMVLAVAL